MTTMNKDDKDIYILLKKETQKQIYLAKRNHYHNAFLRHAKNIKKTWVYLKEVMGSEVGSSTKVSALMHQGQEYSNRIDIANIFNHFFCNIALKLCDSIPQRDFKFSGIPNCESIYFEQITQHEVMMTIMNLNNKNSTGGPDKFSVKYVKCIAKTISVPLAILFNSCMMNGIFPSILKISKVVPIYKGGIHTDPSNYRPISLQSIFSKVFEKLIKSRLDSLLNKCQYGFRTKSSTTMALMDLVHTIESKKDKDMHSIAVFLDLKKAFATVNHDILLIKLDNYGFRGHILKFFSSYLSNRVQYTII